MPWELMEHSPCMNLLLLSCSLVLAAVVLFSYADVKEEGESTSAR
jgi:hypothetical protein